MKRKVDLQNVNMKKLFRRNQIIVTTLAVMIAVAGYLNYMGSQSDGDQGAYTAGNTSYEAGALEISDEDILKENQTVLNGAEDYQEIASLDGDQGDGLTESVSAAELTAVTDSAGQDGNQNRGQNTGQNCPDRTDRTGKSGRSDSDQRHERVRLHSQRPVKQRTDPGKKQGNVVKYHQ